MHTRKYGEKIKMEFNRKYTNKIFVRYADNPSEWTEVKEVNIGSLKKPNTNILEIKMINSPEDDFNNPFFKRRGFK